MQGSIRKRMISSPEHKSRPDYPLIEIKILTPEIAATEETYNFAKGCSMMFT